MKLSVQALAGLMGQYENAATIAKACWRRRGFSFSGTVDLLSRAKSARLVNLMRFKRSPSVPVADEIRAKLTQSLDPLQLDIIDESHLHAGHSGAREGGESHFRVAVVSSAFDGVSRVQRQRMVYQLLASELQGPIHALSVTTQTPAEAEATKP